MVKRLYDDCFHKCKIIPLYLLKKMFASSFKFYSNLSFNKSNLKKLLPCYRQMIISWSQYLFSSPETPTQVLSQFLLYNNYIKIGAAVIYFEKFPNKSINFFYHSYLKMWKHCFSPKCTLLIYIFFD